ncbi:MAG: hypothetical protein AAFP81_00900 [Pseudomonadota bacterium]
MSESLSLKDATSHADKMSRRALAILLSVGVFVVGSVLIAGWFGDANVQDNWVWSVLAAAGTMYAYYAAQADNRDYQSGLIAAVVTSTLKDIAVVAAGLFAAAALLSAFQVGPFNVIIGSGVAGLIAQYVFNRFWVPRDK